MVFTSLPVYLDPPSWNQQQSHHHQSGGGAGNELQSAIQANPVGPGNGGTSMGRPGSMADRARLAKIPQPEPTLKCPRCDSTNTKFCYFNNYSLSQPRHFCKTCRRYWTRGGTLRNVPVGGGCRRNNKRSSKSSASKSNNSSNPAERQTGTATSSSSSTATSGSSMIPSNFHLPFFTNLHPLSEIGVSNFHGMQQIDHAVNYQGGGSESVGLDQWRIQQFPFLDSSSAAVMAPVSGIYHNNPFDGCDQSTSSSLITQLASVKMEDSNPHGINLARHYLGISGINDQYYWGGGGGTGGSWAPPGDLSGFNSTSSGNIL